MGFTAGLANGVFNALNAVDPTKALTALDTNRQRLPPPVAPTALAPNIIRAGSTAPQISVKAEQPTTIVAPRRADDNNTLRRAAGAAGASGVILPPVGVRGAGAIPRTTILGR